MSDMMNPGMARRGGPSRPNAMEQNRSVMNAPDLAYFTQQRGGQEPTIKDFVENILRVPGGVEAPVSELARVLKTQPQNATPLGKTQSMAQSGQPAPAPTARPNPAGMGGMGAGQPPESPGIEALVNRMGR